MALPDQSAPAAEPADATPSSFDRSAELRSILEQDESLLGRIYRHDLAGLSPQEIAEAEGNQTPAFVYNYRLQIAALVDGEVPTSAWVARAVAQKLRRWLRTLDLSPEMRVDLAKFESTVRSRADDAQVQEQELEEAVSKTRLAEKASTAGIYVYTLPHYLRHPIDEASGKTLLKIGHSAADAYYRAASAGRLTALPEDPILLRIYPAEQSAQTEREFHAWLRDADHITGRGRRTGSEWFVTSTKFLDRVARSLGLEVHAINELETWDEA